MKNDVKDWVDVVEHGMRYKENYGNCKRWSTYREYSRGHFPGYAASTGGILPYNLVHAMKQSIIPNVYYRNPYVNVTRRRQPSYQIHAKILEATDNYLLDELNVRGEFKTAVADAFFTDRGILKLGFDSLSGGSTMVDESYERQLAQALNAPITHLAKGRKRERVEYNVNVKPGFPWIVRVMPDFIVVPFGVRTLSDCPWIDHITVRPLDDVKRDPLYTNTKDLEGTHFEFLGKEKERARFFQELAHYTHYVEIHEIRDFKRREIKAFVPGYNKWIRPPSEDALQIEGLPFVDFTFNEDTEYYWGPSDVQIIEPQQLEMNEARTQAMLHRRLALVKFLVEERGMDPIEADKMISENVGPVVYTKGKPTEVVSLLQPHIPPDLVQWPDVIRSDVREMMGFGRQQSGEAPPGRRTKYEMAVVQQAHEVRLDERRDVVASALKNAVRKMNQIIFSKWDRAMVVEVVGVEGAKYWVEYEPKAIRGEYDVKIDVESMSPQTKMRKKREILEVMQAIGKNPRVNIDFLMRMLLTEYEWMDAMQILPPAEDTMHKPMPAEQFIAQQSNLQRNPQELQRRAQANASAIAEVF